MIGRTESVTMAGWARKAKSEPNGTFILEKAPVTSDKRDYRKLHMFALHPKADIRRGCCDVRFGPQADIGQCRVDVSFYIQKQTPCPKEKGPAQWPVPPIAHTSLW